MMRLRIGACLACLMIASQAGAFSGAGTATSDYTNPNSTAGLCTSDNKDEPYYQVGLCQSLTEQFNSGCTKEKVENICKIMAGKKKDKDGNTDYHISFPAGNCVSKDGKKTSEDIVQNPALCAFFMMNYVAMTAARESNWDVLKDEDAGGKGPDGVLGLNLDGDKNTNMENPDYACGCKDNVVTTSGQSNVSFSGQSPGPLDGHHSIICGATMAMTKIEKDGFGRGNSHDTSTEVDAQGKKKDPRNGLAILFPSHQSAKEGDYDEKSPENKNAEWYRKKVGALCKYMFSTSDPWNRELTNDIGGEQFQNKPGPASR